MQLNEAALRWLNDLSAQGILITDADLNICGWNHWLEVHSGRSAAEVIGHNLFAVYPDLITRRLDEHYRDALAGQVRLLSQRLHGYLLPMPPVAMDMPFRQMQQSARIAPLSDANQVVGTITVIDDVTERVAREDALVRLLASEKSARAEAEAANRAKDEFLATVSHELRTPLNAIFGWMQILRTGKFDKATSDHAMGAIERNAKAQAKLIEDILDASRIITGRLHLDTRPIDLVPVIEAAIDTVRPAAEAKSIQINVALDAQAGLVSGDPNRLQQVVWNLLFNAVKFSHKPGRVEIRLRRVDSCAEVTVSDKGQGIRAEFLPHVFDAFRQADNTSARKHGGLGLGLAIVRQLVELHGGTVQAHSEGEGMGATFTIRLPLMALQKPKDDQVQNVAQLAKVVRARRRGSGADLPSLDQLRVLVVDDEADAREMLRIILAEFGAEVTTAATTREALEVLSQWKPDVLVSDIGMPGEDGYSLISQVRALAPERGGRIPAVALTGYAGVEDRLRLLSAGYQIHVTKPVELTELAAAVASLAGRTAQGLNA